MSVIIAPLHPVAFDFMGVSFTWYWLLYPISFFSIFFFSRRYRKQLDISANTLFDSFIFAWIGLLLGARIFYIFFYNLEYYQNHTDQIIAIWNGGMSFHGAVAGGFLGVALANRNSKKMITNFCDLIAPFIPIALFFGRIGNFINGELWGRPSELPWAMIFHRAGLRSRHPSQLYEALLEGLLLFVFLFLNKNKLWAFRGRASGCFLFGYGILRSFAEYFREPDPQIGLILDYFTMGQLLNLFIFFLAFHFLSSNERRVLIT